MARKVTERGLDVAKPRRRDLFIVKLVNHPPQSFGELERLANMLLETPGLHVKIEGHTDNVGRPEDLQALSEARANAIRNFLLEKGVGPERIEAKGMGPQFPLNDNSSDALRAQNRRVEVTVTKL